MAQKTVVELVDDINGTEAKETIEFNLDGIDYQIDLSEDNAQRLREALAKFVENARKIATLRKRGGVHRPADRATPHGSDATRREQNRTIRAWARDSGFQVPDRGRLATKIVTAYHEAHREHDQSTAVDSPTAANPRGTGSPQRTVLQPASPPSTGGGRCESGLDAVERLLDAHHMRCVDLGEQVPGAGEVGVHGCEVTEPVGGLAPDHQDAGRPTAAVPPLRRLPGAV